MHIESIDELYQASWRPIPVDQVPQFGQAIPPAPTPHQSVSELTTATKVVTPVKAAYRPPGARGLEASLAYRRDDSGGSGQNTPTRRDSPGPTNGRRYVPGAPKSPSPRPDGAGGPGKKKHKGKMDKGPPNSGLQRQFEQNGKRPVDVNGGGRDPPPPVSQEQPQPADAVDPALDANAKRLRNLNKKLKAIEELKEKANRGERLEATQLKKIDSESEIRKELADIS